MGDVHDGNEINEIIGEVKKSAGRSAWMYTGVRISLS